MKQIISCKKKHFELHNEPHWEVHSYSGDLYPFRRILPKTSVIGQKQAVSEISSNLTE